jgi:hypothetical protein
MKILSFCVLLLIFSLTFSLRKSKRNRVSKSVQDSYREVCLWKVVLVGVDYIGGYLRLHDQHELYIERKHCSSDEKWDLLKQSDGLYCIKWSYGEKYLSNWENKLAIAPWCRAGELWAITLLGRDSNSEPYGPLIYIQVPGNGWHLTYRKFSRFLQSWEGVDIRPPAEDYSPFDYRMWTMSK